MPGSSRQPSSADAGNPSTPLREGLNQLRKRLLDLTTTNKLLNFRHSAKSCLRVVDELPDELFKRLKDDDHLLFRPVPEPPNESVNESKLADGTKLVLNLEGLADEKPSRSSKRIPAKEYAATLGINTSYDLPEPSATTDDHHKDKYIQTLHYPDELESMLRRISTNARTVIEESGTNMLYLNFGFLEWYESSDSREPLLAPLVALPVELTKTKPSRKYGGMFEFSIEATGEDLLSNLSLVERMKRDFALDIPLLDDEDTPESYFRKVSSLLRSRPGWRIRRQITLSMLHFGKLLMFLDLDQVRHPNLLSNPRMHELLQGQEQRGEPSYSEVYELDELDSDNTLPPIIYDADSSQHSALIDALKGKNMVIEGPPGTGKSQTITNLIAATLVEGKSVLFVSEKLAALEVVRRRLDQAGLGHFCLELHSHRTRKDKFLQDIHQRIQRQPLFREPSDLDDKIRILELQKNDLLKYVRLMNSSFGPLKSTIFDIIWSRDVCLHSHPLLEEFSESLVHPNADSITPPDKDQQRLNVEIYEQHLHAMIQQYQLVSNHPWSGITNVDLTYIQERELISKAIALKDCLQLLLGQARECLDHIGLNRNLTIGALRTLCATPSKLPPLTGEENLNLMSRLRTKESREIVVQFLDSVTALEMRGQEIERSFSEIPSLTDCPEQLKITLSQLAKSGLVRHTKSSLAKLAIRDRDLHRDLKKINEFIAHVAKLLHVESPLSVQSALQYAEVFKLLQMTNFEILHLRSPIMANASHNSSRSDAYAEMKAIQSMRSQLSSKFILSRLPSADELWRHSSVVSSSSFLGRLFSKDYRVAKKFHRDLSKAGQPQSWMTMASDLKELAEFQDRVHQFSTSAQYREAFGAALRGLDTPVKDLEELQAWYAQLSSQLSQFRPASQALIGAIETLPAEDLRALASQVKANSTICDLLNTLEDQLYESACFSDRSELPLGLKMIAEVTSRLDDFATLLEQAVVQLKQICLRDDIKLESLPTLIAEVATYRAAETNLNTNSAVSSLLGESYKGRSTRQAEIRATVQLIDKICIESLPIEVQNFLLVSNYEAQNKSLCQRLHMLHDLLMRYDTLWSEFCSVAGLNEDMWFSGTNGKPADTLGLEQILLRLERTVKDSTSISGWLEYIRGRKTLEESQLMSIIKLAESGRLKPGQLGSAFNFALFNGLCNLIFKTYPALLNFSRSRHERIRDHFMKLDREIIDLRRKQAAYQISRHSVPAGTRTGPVREHTDQALIDHEMGKKRGHIPIRALINRAHKALLGLKPCFMMGPMSVAQYLEPGKFNFDLVVMDEASQLRPEEALGAIIRGSQVVIVGDPKQLPPTSFFDTMFFEQGQTEIDEDDSLAIAGSESILDRACEVYHPIRRLRWHYRSRHESLIAFSNSHFYDQDLILFPSPVSESSSLGIKYHFIPDGLYSNRTNRREADHIVQAVLSHMATCPNESLGVATFNSPQSDLIWEVFYQRLKEDPIAQAYIEKWKDEAEPFFVKNLETVQGDERDCIFISFTYGKDKEGNWYQRFGPVNNTAGHRRLNVLFTRAKLRTEVFSSFHPEDIVIGDSSSLGLKAMKSYLTYAKTGVLEQATFGERPEPNDFELSVGGSLQQHGLDVVPQVGVAGYFIDLAVRHPTKKGAYILGIECDGATYHSAKSARDRDRLREENLVNLGWRIHRIWSTDWLRNRKVEVDKIVQLVQHLASCESI